MSPASKVAKKKQTENSLTARLQVGYVRRTAVWKTDLLEDLKLLAWWRHESFTTLLAQAVDEFLSQYRKEVERAREAHKLSLRRR